MKQQLHLLVSFHWRLVVVDSLLNEEVFH